MVAIVFVALGKLPLFLIKNLELIQRHNPNVPVYLITDRPENAKQMYSEFPLKIQDANKLANDKIKYFNEHCTLEKGFWISAVKRFFVLEAFMQHENLIDVFHLENDVIVFADLKDLAFRIKEIYPGKHAMVTTFDHEHRAVPGFTFLPDFKGLRLATSYFLLKPEQNDMQWLADCRKQFGNDVIDAFPLMLETQDSELRNTLGHVPESHLDYMSIARFGRDLGMVFDAAALGQYLGGTDPHVPESKGPGFINETCYLNYNNAELQMVNGKPQVKFGRMTRFVPLANLHVHSKDLAMFVDKERCFGDKISDMK